MFRDIFNGKPPRLPFGNKSFLENAETTLEMHYITRSGSIEMMKICDETDSVDGKGYLISECLFDFFKSQKKQRKFDKFLPQNLKSG